MLEIEMFPPLLKLGTQVSEPVTTTIPGLIRRSLFQPKRPSVLSFCAFILKNAKLLIARFRVDPSNDLLFARPDAFDFCSTVEFFFRPSVLRTHSWTFIAIRSLLGPDMRKERTPE